MAGGYVLLAQSFCTLDGKSRQLAHKFSEPPVTQPVPPRCFHQTHAGLAKQCTGVPRGIRIIDQPDYEYDRSREPFDINGIRRAELEIRFGPHLGKESREMKTPVLDREVAVPHPVAEALVPSGLVAPAAPDCSCIEREFQIVEWWILCVVGQARTCGIERAPQLGAIARESGIGGGILARIREEAGHHWSKSVEQCPPFQRLPPLLHVDLESCRLPHHANARRTKGVEVIRHPDVALPRKLQRHRGNVVVGVDSARNQRDSVFLHLCLDHASYAL